MIFALVGNQNCGKTTLFNQLTGSNQHVGNFPGVTVAQKVGKVVTAPDVLLVDLPGIYSLSPYSSEETITRFFLADQTPDCLINIIDAANMERNLYLTLQLIELRIPMVLALNMMDEVEANNGKIAINLLQKELGICAVPISAIKKQGLEELLDQAYQVAKAKQKPKHESFGFLPETDDSKEESFIIKRYNYIEYICSKCVIKPEESKEYKRSVKLDNILTHRLWAYPVFFAVMLFIFWLTFDVVGFWLSDLLVMGMSRLSSWADGFFAAYGLNAVLHALIIDGIFIGVGAVLSFLPIILTLFFFLSFLEDSGYMARVAYVMDKPLSKIGLSGRSFVPMLLGFGCTVPAVMATRTLPGVRDRKMTILLTPFMSCSAKLPIYAVFTAAFFPGRQVFVMMSLYAIGIVCGVFSAYVMKRAVFSGPCAPFVMELPNYRFPSAKSVLLLMWDKAYDFIRRAFTIIFVGTVVIWFLQSFDMRLNPVMYGTNSMLADIGRFISPVFSPLGFSDWRVSTALIAGFTAKEAVISTLAVLIGTEIGELGAGLHHLFTNSSAFSFLLFTLLYTPCVAAVAAVKREFGSYRGLFFVVFYQTAFAWVAAFLVFRITNL